MLPIKVVLVAAVLVLMVFALREHGSAKASAYAKLALVTFFAFAIYAVLFPLHVNWVAQRLGVGRGTDLVLYLLVVGFGFFAVNTYLKFKAQEARLAQLARTVALQAPQWPDPPEQPTTEQS